MGPVGRRSSRVAEEGFGAGRRWGPQLSVRARTPPPSHAAGPDLVRAGAPGLGTTPRRGARRRATPETRTAVIRPRTALRSALGSTTQTRGSPYPALVLSLCADAIVSEANNRYGVGRLESYFRVDPWCPVVFVVPGSLCQDSKFGNLFPTFPLGQKNKKFSVPAVPRWT